jgi:hypothetical protein
MWVSQGIFSEAELIRSYDRSYVTTQLCIPALSSFGGVDLSHVLLGHVMLKWSRFCLLVELYLASLDLSSLHPNNVLNVLEARTCENPNRKLRSCFFSYKPGPSHVTLTVNEHRSYDFVQTLHISPPARMTKHIWKLQIEQVALRSKS